MKRVSMKKYIENRKKLLKEEMKLMYDRDKINKQLRTIRESMYSWDNLLRND